VSCAQVDAYKQELLEELYRNVNYEDRALFKIDQNGNRVPWTRYVGTVGTLPTSNCFLAWSRS
jgi:hypothetical protein